MSSQICLKWNSFLSNIATSFESLWEEEGLVDVTLASDGQCLTAHKVILSASSPFFKKVFQTNPCQHPVIILQDVHFSELEALLIFIYKGEVNIEQKNLPALLKAAETLQIRGLSGGDIFAKESYKRLAELEQPLSEEAASILEETPKKKQKISKVQNNSILEKALTPQISQSETVSESTNSERSFKEPDLPESLPNPVNQRLEMKLEPFEMSVEDLQKHSPAGKELAERLDTGQRDCTIGSPKPQISVIAEAREVSSPVPEGSPAVLVNESAQQNPGKAVDQPGSLNSGDGNSSELTDSHTESRNYLLESPEGDPGVSGTVPPGFVSASALESEDFQAIREGPVYPPFPCPFCDKAYASWGFRRRHIKACHTISPKLNCKWCFQVLPTHAAWRRHVISAHNLSASDAHNGLLILEEAHMVLQSSHPTRLETLVNIIKQSAKHNCGQDSGG